MDQYNLRIASCESDEHGKNNEKNEMGTTCSCCIHIRVARSKGMREPIALMIAGNDQMMIEVLNAPVKIVSSM